MGMLIEMCTVLRLVLQRMCGIAVVAVLLVTSHSSFALVCSTDADQAISDGSGSATPGVPAVATIIFPPASGITISDLDFRLEIDHTYVGDLIVTLTSPSGTTVVLMDRPGRPTPNGTFGCSGNNVDVIFDDGAASSVELACAAAVPTIGGTLQPQGSLSDFNGEVLEGTWTVTVTDNAGADTGTIIPSGMCLDESTVPVTISSFTTRAKGNKLIAKWQTSSEAFNLGFNLWGKIDGEWTQLNKRLIPGSIDSVTPQDYRQKISLNKFKGEITDVGISAFSSSAQEDFFGPFEIGEEYGEETVPKYIDWAAQRAKHNAAMEAAGYVYVNGRWRLASDRYLKKFSKDKRKYPDASISIIEKGVYQLTHEELLNAGVGFKGLNSKQLALTLDGVPVPRIITRNEGGNKKFGIGSKIIFFAQGSSGADARYIAENRYSLSVDPTKVIEAPEIELLDQIESGSTHHIQKDRVGDKNLYSFAFTGDQPWYDSSLNAIGQSSFKTLSFDVGENVDLNAEARLSLALIGNIDFPDVDLDGDGEIDPEHHLKVYFNRDSHPEAIYEGYAYDRDRIDLEIVIAEGMLQHGINTAEVELLPDNSYNADLTVFVEATLQSSTANVFSDSFLQFETTDGVDAYQVEDTTGQITAVYSFDDTGNFAQREFVRHASGNGVSTSSPRNNSSVAATHLWFANEAGYLQVDDISPRGLVDEEALDLRDTDFVVIAASSLINAQLQEFAAAHEEMGRATKIVDLQEIYNRYSNGGAVPRAIAEYLYEQSNTSNYKYVLLVGGHTYNYRSFNVDPENELVNLLPTFYRETDGYIKQQPTAVPFVDFDRDGAPDKAIGRWPVRDQDQLKNVIDKTMKWHAQGSHADSKTVALIASMKESRNNFTSGLIRVAEAIGVEGNRWPTQSNVFMDEINLDDNVGVGEKNSHARDLFFAAVNNGAALTIFNGHGSTSQWGFEPFLNSDVVSRFTNVDKPSLMMPLACYTTYYESPNVKSLSELLLGDSSSGAVGLSSPALLGKPGNTGIMAKLILEKMTVAGKDLGIAVMEAKQELHSSSPRYQSVIYNWTTLSDPTLSFKLPNITPEQEIDSEIKRLPLPEAHD